MQQRTIAKRVEAVGIGIHKGRPIKLILEPMEADSGILFYHAGQDVEIPLSISHVVNTAMATVIGKAQAHISTIEHFLSALYAYGIDNIRISVDGDEIPVMDGSAISFCLLLDEAGIAIQKAPKKVLRIKKHIEVREGKKFASFEPSEESSFQLDIAFPHPAIQEQSYLYHFGRKSFIEEIARARTFGFAKDIQSLQSRNLALGASLQNAIGLDSRRILNKEGLRFENEFARHKILDVMGDMMVTGYHIVGKYIAFASSHKLNHALTQKIFEDSENYELITLKALNNPQYEVRFA